MILRAIHEAAAQYRAAVAATDDNAREAAGDRARDYGWVAIIWAIIAVVTLTFAVLAGRCFAEAAGAAFDGATGLAVAI